MIEQRIRHSLCLILYIACAVSAPALSAQSRAQPTVRLEQIAAIAVPVGFEVAGATLSENGSIVFWSREAGIVMVTDGKRLRLLCQGVTLDPLGAFFLDASPNIEIFDGRSGRILRTTVGDRCRTRAVPTAPGKTFAASYSRATKEWVGLSSMNGRSNLWIAGEGRRPRHVAIPFIPIADLDLTHMTLSPYGLVLSALKPPFLWVAVSREGRPLVRGRPFNADTLIKAAADSAQSALLVGMATHALDTGFLQLLADPRSDLRVLVLYDSKGHIARRTALRVSLGLLHFEPAANRVLALRRTGVLELVTYKLHRQS